MYKGERFNCISHIIGAVASIIGFIVLLIAASEDNNPLKTAGFSIYGLSLVILYVISSLYHSLKGRAKKIFRKLDHIAIYILIAGTYTPLTLVSLFGTWRWSLLVFIWSMAVLGIIIDIRPQNGQRIIPVIIYLIMGWVGVAATVPLLNALTVPGFLWLLAGGIFYTSGLFFYAFDSRIRHFHGIWHLFVLAGSICNYFTIIKYVK